MRGVGEWPTMGVAADRALIALSRDTALIALSCDTRALIALGRRHGR